MLDGGRAYTVKQARAPRRVEEYELYWFEEALPPDDLDGYRRLSDAARARIAAGEADATLAPFARSSSSATSTCSNPISRDAAASPSHARSRCSSVGRLSRSSRTASRRASSSLRRCTSSRRSTHVGRVLHRRLAARQRDPPRSRSSCGTGSSPCRQAQGSESNSTRTRSIASGLA